jgi:DNA primase
VRQAIQVLLNYPKQCADISMPEGLANTSQRGAGLLVELLQIASGNPDISPAGLVERFRERPEGPHLEALLADEILISETGAAAELIDNLERIMRSNVELRLEELVAKAGAEGLSDAEKDELRSMRVEDHGPSGQD